MKLLDLESVLGCSFDQFSKGEIRVDFLNEEEMKRFKFVQERIVKPMVKPMIDVYREFIYSHLGILIEIDP